MQESLDFLVVLLTFSMTVSTTVWLVEAFADCAALSPPQLVALCLTPTRIKSIKSVILLSRQLLHHCHPSLDTFLGVCCAESCLLMLLPAAQQSGVIVD